MRAELFGKKEDPKCSESSINNEFPHQLNLNNAMMDLRQENDLRRGDDSKWMQSSTSIVIPRQLPPRIGRVMLKWAMLRKGSVGPQWA
jgi:hypothetical protein